MNLHLDVSNHDMARELTGQDLKRLCPYCPITTYADLPSVPLQRVIGPTGCGFLFFIEKDSPEAMVGHWLALLKQGNSLEVFDPYGAKNGGDPWFLDHTFISKPSLVALKESAPIIHEWAAQNGLNASFNPYRYQVMHNGINTCGRHAAARVMNSHFDERGYHEYVMHYCQVYNCSPDVLVTAWTK